MQPVSVHVGTQAKARRTGPFLFLLGFSIIGLGVLLESWVAAFVLPTVVGIITPAQVQITLSEWAVVNSSLIGTGVLIAVAGWIVWDRQRTRNASPQVPSRFLPSSMGLPFAAFGASMIAAAEYFSVLDTYASLQGSPWLVPYWVTSGAFTYALIGGGLVFIGFGWFARSLA